MAHRQAGEVNARGFAGQANGEGRATRGLTVGAQADPGGERGDVGQQQAHFFALGAVVERGDDFDRPLQLFEIGR